MSGIKRIECRVGDACTAGVTITGGFGAQYTEARLQVRWAYGEDNDSNAPLIDIDQDSGITIDQPNSSITIVVGASLTEAITGVDQPREALALLRLYDPADADDRISFLIPWIFLPDLIDD